MNLSQQLAKHFRDVYYGENYTGVNIKESIKNIDWIQATTEVQNLNTIAALIFHMNYYVNIVMKTLQGGPLEGNDKYAFDLPPIHSQADWENLLHKFWSDADTFANLIEELTEDQLGEPFLDGKYGTYFRNLNGVIEHNYYHLGQISLIKKIIS
ncbi:MAG: DinB family protein [Saprospiraceae bacterium]